jgi:hypothetical protein
MQHAVNYPNPNPRYAECKPFVATHTTGITEAIKHDRHVTLRPSHGLSGDLNVNTSLEHGVVALAATTP